MQLQADAPFRADPEDLGQVYVRSAKGAMIPVSALINVQSIVGPEQLERFNGFLAAKVLGNSLPHISTGEAIRIVEEVAREVLPAGYELAWTGQVFQEKRTGSTSAIAFVFGIIMVFLILAAQYEKWSLPLAVILAVPFALFGALAAVMIRGMPNDIYLVISTGAGSAARRSMGTGVFGGMLAATFIATIFIPMFFSWLSGRKASRVAMEHAHVLAEEETAS